MDVREAIAKQHSVRRFDQDRAVNDEDIAPILEAVRLNPPSKNGRSWRFVIVRS